MNNFTNEDEFRTALINALVYNVFDVCRHEDKVSNYMPDISFAGCRFDGWMEVKWLPEDPSSLGAVAHWTIGQEVWLRQRGRAGAGLCFLVVGTPRRILMWRWDRLQEVRHARFDDAVLEAWLIAPDLLSFGDALMERLRRVSQRLTP